TSITKPITIGKPEPKENTERQQNTGIIRAETSPATIAPTLKPLDTTIIIKTRQRRGVYSPTSATAFGMMPPNPTPAIKRARRNSDTEAASPVHSVINEKNNVATLR